MIDHVNSVGYISFSIVTAFLSKCSEDTTLRSTFIPQMSLGAIGISEIEFDIHCRHEIVPILMALQYLYVKRPSVMKKICNLIQADLLNGRSQKFGCIGLKVRVCIFRTFVEQNIYLFKSMFRIHCDRPAEAHL